MERPKVGIGVMVFKEGKVLLGKRKSAHGEGEYAWPGGHLEFGESVVECAKREVMEETGLSIKEVEFIRLYNMNDQYNKHYLDIAMKASWEEGDPKTLEPEKCENWNWYDLNDLPTPLFATIPTTIESLKTGQIFFDGPNN